MSKDVTPSQDGSRPSLLTTTQSLSDGRLSLVLAEPIRTAAPDEAHRRRIVRYRSILSQRQMVWTERFRIVRGLGSGGQGVVYLCERLGSDHFFLPVALKVFSPERYGDVEAYDAAMARMARVAVEIAQIQQDNLVDVHNVTAVDGVRMLEMEWIDGYDLSELLTETVYDRSRDRLSEEGWAHLNDVIMTTGPRQPRLKPGIAIAVLRDVLAALAALHQGGIVHGDVKPANVMLKRTGFAKLIDFGSAFHRTAPPARRSCTPAYAALEVLDGEPITALSDLASLGYVLIEMLAGASPFDGIATYSALCRAKRTIVERLPAILPEEVVRNELLMSLVRGLVAPDPTQRFPSAEAADLVDQGAASFQRQLVRSNLSSEYDNEIRTWLSALDQPARAGAGSGRAAVAAAAAASAAASSRNGAVEEAERALDQDEPDRTRQLGTGAPNGEPGGGAAASGLSDCVEPRRDGASVAAREVRSDDDLIFF